MSREEAKRGEGVLVVSSARCGERREGEGGGRGGMGPRFAVLVVNLVASWRERGLLDHKVDLKQVDVKQVVKDSA